MVENSEVPPSSYVNIAGQTHQGDKQEAMAKVGTGATRNPIAPSPDQTVILSTKRLTLRPPAERDLDDLVRLANNPAVANNLGSMPHPYTHEDGLHWINHLSRREPKYLKLAITDRFDDSFLGGCGYRPTQEYPDRLAIGYWLGQPYWGKGFAAEAAQAVIDYAFENEDIDEIWATVRMTNYQSKRVIEKCGFQFAHHGMSKSMSLGGMVTIDYFALSRKTWESLHAWGEH